GTGWGVFQVEHARPSGFVSHFDQKRAPALLNQTHQYGAALDRDPALRIDADREQTSRIQDPLDFLDRTRLIAQIRSRIEPFTFSLAEGFTQVLHSIREPSYLGGQRLHFNRCKQSPAERMH